MAGLLLPARVLAATPDTIFGSTTPATIDSGDGNSVELGVKFSSEVAGNITGIRFYKASTNTGTHIGSLWTTSGTLLASATFSGETTSGWQQVNFTTPVAITANTTYVAAYLAPNGHYSDTPAAFASAGTSNPPLTALANTSSANGVYAYSTTSVFPTSTYKATNYWVDVDFEPATPLTAPGQVTGVTATAGAGSASLTWNAPSSGGTPTKYTITPYTGSTAQTAVSITGTPPATGTTITGLTNSTAYTFTITASNSVGSGATSEHSNAITPTAAPATPLMDANVTVNGHSTATTPSFSTAEAGEQLLAFVSSDGPSGSGKQSATVTGAGLTWTLVKRANSQSGDTEIWSATAPNALTNATVTSTPTAGGFDQSLTVISIEHSTGIGASVTGGAASGAPSVSLITTGAGSLVYAVGNDWDAATARTLGPNQTMLHQYLDTATGDTFWSQYASQSTGLTGSVVTLNDTAPTSDRWNMAAVEILGGGTGGGGATTTAPGQVTGVTATAGTGGSATLQWTAPTTGGAPTKYTITPYTGSTAQTATTITGTPPATGTTITGLTAGTSYTFTVTAANTAGSGPASEHSAPVTPLVESPSAGAPANTSVPVVTGTVATGQTLTTSNGTWTNSPTGFSYVWQDCATNGTGCSNIAGATSGTYTVASSDAGYTITAVVTAANTSGSNSASASPVPLTDEFNGSNVQANLWTVMDQQGDTSNEEVECFLPSQVAESGGFLSETLISHSVTCPAGTPNSSNPLPDESGAVQMRSVNFTYGTVAVRAKMGSGSNAWPTIWLLGASCQQPNWLTNPGFSCGWPADESDAAEIDIAEIKGFSTGPATVWQNLIASGGNQTCKPTTSNTNANYHTYELNWTPASVTWKIDGVETCKFTSHVPTHPMFLIIETADPGGYLSGPQVTSVDYAHISFGG